MTTPLCRVRVDFSPAARVKADQFSRLHCNRQALAGAIHEAIAGTADAERNLRRDAPYIAEGCADDAEVIGGRRQGVDTRHIERPYRGLETHRAAIRSRSQGRALGLSAETDRHHARAHSRCRAAR